MKKKFLSLALVLAMALTLLPTAAFAADCVHTGASGTHSMTKITAVSNGDYDCSQGYVTTAPAADANLYQCNVCHKYFTATMNATTDTTIDSVSEASAGVVQPKTHTWSTGATKSTCTNTTDGDSPKTCSVECTHSTWDSTGKCETCEYQCQHPEKDGHAYDESHNCKTCGLANATKDHDYTGTEGARTCSICGKAEPTTPAGTPAIMTATAGFDEGSATSILLSASVSNAAADTALEISSVTKNGKALTATTDYTAKISKVTASTASARAEATSYSGTLTLTTAAANNDAFVITFNIAGATGTGTTQDANCTYHTAPPPTTPTTPTTPDTSKDDNKAPSNNSQGIPVASDVNTASQANQAISTLKNTDSDTLSERLMTNETAASSFASLESAVKHAKGITVSVEVDTASVPSVVRTHAPSVVGAAFNASGSSVKLVVDAPSKSYSAASGYQLSMTLTGVSNASKLAVPVIVTLPLPSDVQAGRVVVLHYHDGSEPTVIVPVVSGSWLRFPVTGFSDFVITDAANAGNNGVSQAFTTVQGGNRDDGSLDDATLAAISAILSGDGVFVDVPGTHWAAKEIRWARDGGLMSGYGNGYFGPTASTTRQQLWMVLARLSGTRPADMAMARQWAINTGVSDGSDPTGVLSRQQLVTMLYRFAKSQGKDVSASAKLSGYTDSAKVASYAKEALSWAAAKGIMSGSNGKLNPEGSATRAHFAVFLYRYSNG